MQERNKINGLLRGNIAGASTRWGIEVLMIPSDFVTLAKSFSQYLSEHAPRKS